MSPSLRLLAVLLCGALSACHGDAIEAGSSDAASAPELNSGDGAERPLGTDIGYQAPDFQLPQLQAEGEIALSELRGKVVLITFWASWCGPCRQEIPALERGWKKRRDKDFVLLGISIDEDAAAAKGFLTMFPVSYPTLLDLDGGSVGGPWSVSSIPMSVLIDKDGVVRRKHLGYTPAQLKETLQEVDDLLN